MNVSPCAYRVGVSEYTLLPDVPYPPRRYQVTVTLPRQDRDEAMLPPGGEAAVEMAAAAEAQGLVTVWACTQLVVSMIVELPSAADALAAGVAVARVLKGGGGMASVRVEPIA
jgi:hypothetical protein